MCTPIWPLLPPEQSAAQGLRSPPATAGTHQKGTAAWSEHRLLCWWQPEDAEEAEALEAEGARTAQQCPSRALRGRRQGRVNHRPSWGQLQATRTALE